MIQNFVPRLYQELIFHTAIQKNTLVVLPTGLGKTAVSIMVAAKRLEEHPNSKILLVAPTKPLVEQHKTSFEKYLCVEPDSVVIFTGNVKPEKRAELWTNAKIILATPQGLENDIITHRIKLEEVSLLIVDEAHRAVGNYAYTFVAKQYNKTASYPRILALSASPGSELEKINEVCQNLFIEDVEIRTLADPDVKPYVQQVDVKWLEVELPEELREVKKYLDDCFKTKIQKIKEKGFLKGSTIVSKKDILTLQVALHAHLAKGEKDFDMMAVISIAAEAMKVFHAIELIACQSPLALVHYIERIQQESMTSKVKAVQNLACDENFKSALIKAKSALEKSMEHPKLQLTRDLVTKTIEKDSSAKLILFNQYRENASLLVQEVNKLANVRAALFVGQQKKNGTGMSQKEQKALLDKFRKGEYNVLVATSIGEEGLDIPKVDVVLFYEPIPSAIRHIQRRGRTGRSDKGNVFILVTKNSQDEFYKWSAIHKEKRMIKTFLELKKKFIGFTKQTEEVISKKDVQLSLHQEKIQKYQQNQQCGKDQEEIFEKREHSLNEFMTEKPLFLIADHRERSTTVIRELVDLGIKVNLSTLEIGDYVLSSRVVVEFKTVKDFVDSIIDGRLLEQLKAMKEKYPRPLLVIEGIDDIYSQRNIHPNAIRGMLSTITISYGIPVLQTKTPKETAQLLAVIAKREQEVDTKDFTLHTKKPLSLKEQQEYVIESIPSVGPQVARSLLDFFKTPRAVLNASEEDLKKVEGVGEKIAKGIRDVMDRECDENK